jgi:hypothetical protein
MELAVLTKTRGVSSREDLAAHKGRGDTEGIGWEAYLFRRDTPSASGTASEASEGLLEMACAVEDAQDWLLRRSLAAMPSRNLRRGGWASVWGKDDTSVQRRRAGRERGVRNSFYARAV